MVKIKFLLKITTTLCAAAACASVAPFVALPYALTFLLLVALALYSDFINLVPVPRRLLNILSVGVLASSIFRISPEHFVKPIVESLLILVAIKLLEDKKSRDYMQIYFLCTFLLIGSTLITLNAIFLLYFSLLLAFSTVSLVLLAYFSHDPELTVSLDSVNQIARYSLYISTISIPVAMIFFLILPRTNFPLFGFLNQTVYSSSGFSEIVSLGDVAEIQEDSRVIFRAETERLDENHLYWRGIVLEEFDGTSWKRSSSEPGRMAQSSNDGEIVQTIYLEPYGNRYLFALDRPVRITLMDRKPRDLPDNVLREPVFHRMRYRVASTFTPLPVEKDPFEKRHIQLPEGFSQRITDLVEAIRKEDPDNPASAVFRFIRDGEYSYSLENLPVSGTPLDDFLFKYKRGNCEFFASSLAVMFRAAGIPARLVGGYKGGYHNRAGGYYMVLHKHAHVWVEACIDGKGWTRFDPTPYAPDNPALLYEKSILLQIKLAADIFNYYWDRIVIHYDLNRQMAIFRAMRATFENPALATGFNRNDVLKFLAFLFILVVPAFIGYLVWSHRRDPERRLVAEFQEKLLRHGYRRQPHQGLDEFLVGVDNEEIRRRAEAFVSEFHGFYYQDRRITGKDKARLKSYIRAI